MKALWTCTHKHTHTHNNVSSSLELQSKLSQTSTHLFGVWVLLFTLCKESLSLSCQLQTTEYDYCVHKSFFDRLWNTCRKYIGLRCEFCFRKTSIKGWERNTTTYTTKKPENCVETGWKEKRLQKTNNMWAVLHIQLYNTQTQKKTNRSPYAGAPLVLVHQQKLISMQWWVSPRCRAGHTTAPSAQEPPWTAQSSLSCLSLLPSSALYSAAAEWQLGSTCEEWQQPLCWPDHSFWGLRLWLQMQAKNKKWQTHSYSGTSESYIACLF